MEQLLQEILDLYGMDREVFFGKRKFLEVTTARKHLVLLALDRGIDLKLIKAFMNLDHNSIRHHRRNNVLAITPEVARISLPITMMIEDGADIQDLDAAFPEQRDLVRQLLRRSTARFKRHRVGVKEKMLTGVPVRPSQVKDALSNLGVRMGTMTSLISTAITPEVRAYWIKECVNGKYGTLEECFADFLTDKYYEDQQ